MDLLKIDQLSHNNKDSNFVLKPRFIEVNCAHSNNIVVCDILLKKKLEHINSMRKKIEFQFFKDHYKCNQVRDHQTQISMHKE